MIFHGRRTGTMGYQGTGGLDGSSKSLSKYFVCSKSGSSEHRHLTHSHLCCLSQVLIGTCSTSDPFDQNSPFHSYLFSFALQYNLASLVEGQSLQQKDKQWQKRKGKKKNLKKQKT